MGELQSANCGFNSLYLAFLPSVYIISEKGESFKGAILSRFQAPMVRKELNYFGSIINVGVTPKIN